MSDEHWNAPVPEGADADVFSAWGDYNADVSDEERYHTYADYVESSTTNYEHLINSADAPSHPHGLQAGLTEVEDLTYWHGKLKAEYDRLFPICGACGQVHQINAPAQCDVAPGIRVFLEVWVTSPEAGGPEHPISLIRDMIHEGEHVSVIDAFLDEGDS